AFSHPQLDDRYVGNVARPEAREIDRQVIGIEPRRHVEFEARGHHRAIARQAAGEEGYDTRRDIDREIDAFGLRHPRYGNLDRARDGLGDRPHVVAKPRAVALDELELRRAAVSFAQPLIAP